MWGQTGIREGDMLLQKKENFEDWDNFLLQNFSKKLKEGLLHFSNWKFRCVIKSKCILIRVVVMAINHL